MDNWFIRAASAVNPAFLSNPLVWIIWAIFGNQEDSVFGDPRVMEPRGYTEKNWAAVWYWWRRNPAHNLCFHVLRTGPFETPGQIWPTDGKKFYRGQGPIVSFRAGGWEGYIGWRPRIIDGKNHGVFGMAFRRK